MERRCRQWLYDDEYEDIPRSTLDRWKKRKETDRDENDLLLDNEFERVESERDVVNVISDREMDHGSIRGLFEDDADSIASEQSSTSSNCSRLPNSSRSSSQYSRSDDDTEEFIYEVTGSEENDPTWLTQPLYVGSDYTVGQSVEIILDYFLKNALTKKSLGDLLKILAVLLPRPNFLPKTKYLLDKLLEPIMPSHKNAIKKYRYCSDCSTFLGDWSKVPIVTLCKACESSNINGMFVEYDIRSVLRDAFEIRHLHDLIDMHTQSHSNDTAEGYISDVIHGSEYRKLKEEAIPGEYDILLIWNTDGFPTSSSSAAQIWAIQVQIANIPPENRRAFQIVCGLYYSICKPDMNTFLKPFADVMKDLYANGIDWIHKESGTMKNSKVIAPIATLDCPARASVQNIMQFNGMYGCTFCEHPGQTCRTGRGINHVYPVLDMETPLRMNDNMLSQAAQAINTGVSNIKGVKGPTIVATLPFFDIAIGFVPDYMHAILLGVVRMLISCWCDSKNNDKPFYIKKQMRDEIDKNLEVIKPPDAITRTPRPLKYLKFWKASELRAFLLFYSPILLKGILPEKYYQHYLLLVCATQLMLKSRIHSNEIDLAESFMYLFTADIAHLYGLEKCSFNVHEFAHLARSIRHWGPMWAWSAFPFEDGNGYLLRLTHGPNKIDVEIFNTLKYANALQILKQKIYFPVATKSAFGIALGSPVNISLQEDGLLVLQNALSLDRTDIRNEYIRVYTRVKIDKQIFTSQLYKKQKKRDNSCVIWNDSLGIIKYFVSIDRMLFAIVQKLEEQSHESHSITHRDTGMNLNEFIKPIRSTYCLRAVPVHHIKGKYFEIANYGCFLPNIIERKL